MQVFLRRSAWYYLAAVLYHTLVDATAVYLVGIGLQVWAIEAAVAVFALISLGIIFYYKRKGEPPAVLEEAPIPPAPEGAPMIDRAPDVMENE
jgi:hypothetical protein